MSLETHEKGDGLMPRNRHASLKSSPSLRRVLTKREFDELPQGTMVRVRWVGSPAEDFVYEVLCSGPPDHQMRVWLPESNYKHRKVHYSSFAEMLSCDVVQESEGRFVS